MSPIQDETNAVENVILVSAIVIGSIIIMFLITTLLWFCYNKKKTPDRSSTSIEKKTPLLTINWEKNYDYENNESRIELIGIEKNDHESILPEWLKERKEMLFSSDCIEKGKELGSGQFGAVFKGKFIQGHAVYVELVYLLLVDIFKNILCVRGYKYSLIYFYFP